MYCYHIRGYKVGDYKNYIYILNHEILPHVPLMCKTKECDNCKATN